MDAEPSGRGRAAAKMAMKAVMAKRASLENMVKNEWECGFTSFELRGKDEVEAVFLQLVISISSPGKPSSRMDAYVQSWEVPKSGWRCKLPCGASCRRHVPLQTHPLEPILVPRLRIPFADFPYLLYPIGQRLFTLET